MPTIPPDQQDVHDRDVRADQAAIRARSHHPFGTCVPFEKDELERSIPERFEKIVRLYRDHLAVASTESELTYDQLNRLANRLARMILQHDNQGTLPVALLFDDDASVVAALIGVLKAGSFFLVLDPTLPDSRIRHILEDSGARFIVADRPSVSRARKVAGQRDVIDFDDTDASLSDHNLNRVIKAGAVAAIVYTSGSTGDPKGVIQTHRMYLHDRLGEYNHIHLCPDDRMVRPGSFTTGGGVGTIMRLLNGVSLYRFDVNKEGLTGLGAWLTKRRITIMALAAPIFRAFTATFRGNETFPDLRVIRLASDRINRQDVEAYKKHFSASCVLVHGLSTTETHALTRFSMDKNSPIAGNIIPVGFAEPDKNLVLLDDNRKEVSAGEGGEIAVRSRYLSPGYWHKPELTKMKFIRESDDEDASCYLTGDLGRMSQEGCLTHLGRKDLRVKVRGFGVEVGEIESALIEHPGVKEAVVSTAEDPTGERRLVAYVVPQDSSATARALRSFLREKLPDYMIPSHFVMMDALPLNSGGKADRQSLGKV